MSSSQRYVKARKYNVTLPPTPCTEEMRVQMVQAAEQLGESLAEIQRRAFSLFLAKNNSNAIVTNSNAGMERG